MEVYDRSLEDIDHTSSEIKRQQKEEDDITVPSDSEDENEDFENIILKIDGKDTSLKEYIARKSEEKHLAHKQSTVRVSNLTYRPIVPVNNTIQTVRTSLINTFTCYNMRHKEGAKVEKEVLTDINFVLPPKSMTVLLGAPGSGKSSLLDIIANRRADQTITGEVLLNEKVPDKSVYHQEVSYVIQGDEHHFPLLSVEETFKFAANLQMPDKYTQEEINQRVDIILQLLKLTHAKDTIVGGQLLRGVSGGEKHRVTIGIEWVKRPSFFLLDEPTTGLDSGAAFRVGKNLRIVSRFGPPVLCSLLQPSNELFNIFDYLIIMSKGEVAYWGPRKGAIDYFADLGLICPEVYGEAEFLAEVVDSPEKFSGGDVESKNRNSINGKGITREEIIKLWRTSELKKQMDLKMTPENISKELQNAEIENINKQEQFITTRTNTNNSNNNDNTQSMNQLKDDIIVAEKDPNIGKAIPFQEPSFTSQQTPQQQQQQQQPNIKNEYDMKNEKSNNLDKNGKPINNLASKGKNFQYAQSTFTQFKWLMWRGMISLKRDIRRLAIRESNEILIALIIGTFFLRIGDNQTDTRNKVALLFFGLAHLGFGSMATIPKIFMDKPIYQFQQKARYYSPGVYLLSQLLTQIPFALVETILYGSIVFWLSGLNPGDDGTRFLFFLFILLWVYMAGVVYAIMCAYAFPAPVMASILGAIVLVIFVMFSGFLIPYNDIPSGWIWGFWISYFQYALFALATNEFVGQTVTCDANELVPRVTSSLFSGVQNQVCPVTSGEAFLRTFNGYTNINDRWWLLACVIGFYAIFTLVTWFGLKFFQVDFYPLVATNDVSKKLKKCEDKAKDYKFQSTLSFENIGYTVPVKGQQKSLITNINGYVKPGMLLALMGASGAGKSTLLDVLAGRKTAGKMTGKIQLNGKEIDRNLFHRYFGYVEQNDVLYPFHTVLEALQFAAISRLPREVTKEERNTIINRVIDTLDLRSIAGSMIGFPGNGLRLEQIKRVSIGIEMCSEPQILFLDEPTSGLDSIGADRVMKAIKNVTKTGTSVICTIHQPSSRIFFRTTHLLLLSPGGTTAYFGPMGKKAETILQYFESNFGAKIDEGRNPADFILELSQQSNSSKHNSKSNFDENSEKSSGKKEDEEDKDKNNNLETDITGETRPKKNYQLSGDNVKSVWENSQEKKRIHEEIEKSEVDQEKIKSYTERYPLSFGKQLWINFDRFMLGYRRNPQQNVLIIFRSVFLGVMVGLAFYQLGNTQQDANLRVSLIFFMALFANFSAFSSMIPIFFTRPLYYRERAEGMYRSSAFGLAKFASDIPGLVVEATIFMVIIYFIAHLEYDAGKFFFFYLVYIGLYLVTSTVGQIFAIYISSIDNAGLFFSTFVVFNAICAGFLLPRGQIPVWWIWGYWSSYIQYGVQALVVSQLKDMTFYCPNNNGAILVPFTDATTGQTVDSYYCPITSGKDILNQFGMNEGLMWGAVGAVYGFYFIFMIIALIGFRFVNHNKR